MPLTPIDVQQKTFGPELRGYNMDEVDDFLDEVVTALKDYDQRVRDAQDRIRALEVELSTRGEDESAISRALVAAQKQADALLSEAQTDADRIRADAHDEASRLRTDRESERLLLTQDIARMRASVADLKRRITELAASAGADLDAMDAAASGASEAVSGGYAGAANGTAESGAIGAYDSAAVGDGLDAFGEAQPGGDVVEEGDADTAAAVGDRPYDDEESGEVDDTEILDEDATDDLDTLDEETDEDVDEEMDEDYASARSGQHMAGADGETDSDAEEDGASNAGAEAESLPTGRRPWERGSV